MALTRSEQMSRIRGASTRPEVFLREALAQASVEAAPQRRVAGQRVDFVIGERVVVLVDGCFWHGCPRHYVMPRSNTEFWAKKLRENVERDGRQTAALTAAGWTVVRLWEHAIFETPQDVLAALLASPVTGMVNSLRVVRVDVHNATSRIEERCLVDLADTATIVDRVRGPRVTAKWRRPRALSRSLPASVPRSE